MPNAEVIQKTVVFIEELPKKIFFHAELWVRLMVEEKENIELQDDTIRVATGITIKNWIRQFSDEVV